MTNRTPNKGIVDEAYLKPCQITYNGNNYSPVTHKEVIETIDKYLRDNNLIVVGKEYIAASGGQRAIGKIIIKYHGDDELGYMISWKNSLDGSMSFGIASGSCVHICSNGNVFGSSFSYKRRHCGSANVDILSEIKTACDKLEETMQEHIQLRDMMKRVFLTKRKCAEMAGILFMNDVILPNQLSVLKKEMETPSIDYKSPDTLWEFYNYCTYAVKNATPLSWHKVHQEISDFFKEEFNLSIRKTPLAIAE